MSLTETDQNNLDLPRQARYGNHRQLNLTLSDRIIADKEMIHAGLESGNIEAVRAAGNDLGKNLGQERPNPQTFRHQHPHNKSDEAPSGPRQTFVFGL